MFRLTFITLLLVAPLAIADIPRDDLLSIIGPATVLDPRDGSEILVEGERYYISVCRTYLAENPVETQIVTEQIVDRCATSGLYQESNGHANLQVRSGVDGFRIYQADTKILP